MKSAGIWLLRLLISAGLSGASYLFLIEFMVSPEEKKKFLWELRYMNFPLYAGVGWFVLVTLLTLKDREGGE